MRNKANPADFSPTVPDFPDIGMYQPIYGKFDLTTYIQGASDYEIMSFLVQCYNATLEGYSEVTQLSKDTVIAYNQLQTWVNTWFDNLDVQNEINEKLQEMYENGSFANAIASSPVVSEYFSSAEGTQQVSDAIAAKIDIMAGDGSLANVIKQTGTVPDAVRQYLESVEGSKQLSDATARKIEQMATNGELGNVISKTTDLQKTTTDWLNTNVAPTGSAVVVDKSLTISGAAADAQNTGYIKQDVVNLIDPSVSKVINLVDTNNLIFNKTLYKVVGSSTPHSIYDEANTAVCLNLIRVKKGDVIYCGDNLPAHRYSLYIYNADMILSKCIDQASTYNVENDGFAMINIWGCTSASVANGYKTYLNVNKNYGYYEFGVTEDNLSITEYKTYSEIPVILQNGYYNDTQFYENDVWTSCKIPCNPFEKFKIECYLMGVSNFSVAVFLDIDGNIIGRTPTITSDTHIHDYVVETPAKCRYIIVQNRRDKGVRLTISRNIASSGIDFSNLKGGFTGDSICYGSAYEGGYAKVLNERYGLQYNNVAVSGGHIATDRTDAFIISNSIPSLDDDIDFLIMEGGINDYSNFVPVGELTNGYADEINQKTFFGGLEKLFRDAVTRFPTIPKAFLIVHKVNDTCIKTDDIHRVDYPNGKIITFDYFVDCIYKAARKYGIKIIDINNTTGFDTYNTTLKSLYTGIDGDGLHPNRDGYEKFYVPSIKDWVQNVVLY